MWFNKNKKDGKREKTSKYEDIMVENIIKLSETIVRDIMVPRVDVHAIDLTFSIEEIIQKIQEKGVSRLPVFDEDYENVIGILHAKDLLKFCFNKKSDLKTILRKPYFVPEVKNIIDLLKELRENKIHLAIVVDEFGSISGIVCLEDIIERIVGDIKDEFDKDNIDFLQIDENSYVVNSRLTLHDLNNLLGTNFDEEDIDTVGGLIYMLLGKIPSLNEEVEYKGWIFKVESLTGRKIKKIKITKKIDRESQNEE